MEKMQPGFIEDRIAETLLTTVALRAFDAQLADAFPGAELCFDVFSVWCSRKSKKHDVLQKMQATFKWGLDNEQELSRWHPGLQVVSSESLTWQMGKYHWFCRLMRHIPQVLHSSRMLRVQIA